VSRHEGNPASACFMLVVECADPDPGAHLPPQEWTTLRGRYPGSGVVKRLYTLIGFIAGILLCAVLQAVVALRSGRRLVARGAGARDNCARVGAEVERVPASSSAASRETWLGSNRCKQAGFGLIRRTGAEGLEPPTYGFGDRRSTN
jgi:hypothetical protein